MKTIEEMARAAGHRAPHDVEHDDLIAFGKLVRTAERARIAERLRDAWAGRAVGADSTDFKRKRLVRALIEELEKP